MGSGTTLVEAKLLNRNAIGIDINQQSVSISETNLQFQCDSKSKIHIRQANANNLSFIKDSGVDFIFWNKSHFKKSFFAQNASVYDGKGGKTEY